MRPPVPAPVPVPVPVPVQSRPRLACSPQLCAQGEARRAGDKGRGGPHCGHAHPEAERIHADEQAVYAERPVSLREEHLVEGREEAVEIGGCPNAAGCQRDDERDRRRRADAGRCTGAARVTPVRYVERG